MKKLALLTITIICSIPYFAYSQIVEWQNTIGGSQSDYLWSVQQTPDGGYILGGYSDSDISGDKTENSNGNEDFWILKMDSLGNIQWQNTIGGSDEDQLWIIERTMDGGYILGGSTQSDISGDKTDANNGYRDYWVVKIDSVGTIQWQNSIGGNSFEDLSNIKQTADGGYILGGMSDSPISGDKTESNMIVDYWIVKIDASGNIQWENTIGGSEVDYFSYIIQTTDGGYILGGESASNISGDKTENTNGQYDLWIVKIDATGTIQWQNTIGGSDFEFLYSIQQTTDGGYMLGAASSSPISGDKTENCNGLADYWIVKIDSTGTIQWQNTIGGNSLDELSAAWQTADGGYILGGTSYSQMSGDKTENSIGGYDYWIVKTDASGNIQWQNTIGGSDEDALGSIQQTTDGWYILGGFSYSSISGDKTENCLGQTDYWLVKMGPDTSTGTLDSPPGINNWCYVYPNPAQSNLTIETNTQSSQSRLLVTDILGNNVLVIPFTGNKHTIDVSSFSNGIYFLQMENESNVYRSKFVKE